MTRKPSTAAPILAALAIVLPLALYAGGYYALAERVGIGGSGPLDGATPNIRHYFRIYPRPWQAVTFKPLAYVESLFGIPVYTIDREEWDFSDGEPS